MNTPQSSVRDVPTLEILNLIVTATCGSHASQQVFLYPLPHLLLTDHSSLLYPVLHPNGKFQIRCVGDGALHLASRVRTQSGKACVAQEGIEPRALVINIVKCLGGFVGKSRQGCT